MCGIVGYIGDKKASEVLLKGLSYLEYRGYDSSGVALMTKNKIEIFKAPGKLNNLREVLNNQQNICNKSTLGIGHIRWATHGLPTELNAHPHTCNCGSLVVVHNGIIENYKELKAELEKCGCEFKSQTDSEVAAHLIAHEFSKCKDLLVAMTNAVKKIQGAYAFCAMHKTFKDLLKAMTNAVKKIQGAYAFCAMHKTLQDRIVVARKNAPLIIGVGEGENYIASDIPAIIEYTKKAIYLNDNQVAEVKKNSIKITDLEGNILENKIEMLPFEPVALSKMGFKHYMLKEIHEQSDVARNVLSGKLKDSKSHVVLEDVKLSAQDLKNINRIQIIACGTSLHAGLVGKYILEKFAKIPTDVEASSEYIYRDTIADKNTLVIGISQSGETADTITAIKQVKEKGSHVLIITNRPDSTMARLADSLLPVNAGIEVSVAATKSYMAQLLSLYLLTIYMTQIVNENTVNDKEIISLKQEMLELPNKIETLTNNTDNVKAVAKKYSSFKDFIFIARGINFPTALEGALKLATLMQQATVQES